jgi:CheY-like chemotaxis protein
LVEDDQDIQDNLRLFLELEGYSVQSALNGREALHKLRAGGPVRMILLDLMMPVMDGYEFLEALTLEENASLAAAPIVLLSASPDVERIAGVHQLHFIRKPIDLEQLVEAITAADATRAKGAR